MHKIISGYTEIIRMFLLNIINTFYKNPKVSLTLLHGTSLKSQIEKTKTTSH